MREVRDDRCCEIAVVRRAPPYFFRWIDRFAHRTCSSTVCTDTLTKLVVWIDTHLFWCNASLNSSSSLCVCSRCFARVFNESPQTQTHPHTHTQSVSFIQQSVLDPATTAASVFPATQLADLSTCADHIPPYPNHVQLYSSAGEPPTRVERS